MRSFERGDHVEEKEGTGADSVEVENLKRKISAKKLFTSPDWEPKTSDLVSLKSPVSGALPAISEHEHFSTNPPVLNRQLE